MDAIPLTFLFLSLSLLLLLLLLLVVAQKKELGLGLGLGLDLKMSCRRTMHQKLGPGFHLKTSHRRVLQKQKIALGLRMGYRRTSATAVRVGEEVMGGAQGLLRTILAEF